MNRSVHGESLGSPIRPPLLSIRGRLNSQTVQQGGSNQFGH